jgi:hypothetical protein
MVSQSELISKTLGVLSSGPGVNETTSTYRVGGMAHDIRVLAQVSPDVLLLHQMKLEGFRRKMKDRTLIPTLPRDIRLSMFRGING